MQKKVHTAVSHLSPPPSVCLPVFLFPFSLSVTAFLHFSSSHRLFSPHTPLLSMVISQSSSLVTHPPPPLPVFLSGCQLVFSPEAQLLLQKQFQTADRKKGIERERERDQQCVYHGSEEERKQL